MKNPTLATILNIIPGLGYVYIGGTKRTFGILLLIAILASIASSFDPLLYREEYMNSPFRLWDLIALVGVVVGVAAFMYDGYASANDHNRKIK